MVAKQSRANEGSKFGNSRFKNREYAEFHAAAYAQACCGFHLNRRPPSKMAWRPGAALQSQFALLPVFCGPAMVEGVRSLAIILVALLLPLSMSAPSAMACSTTACCGPNCSSNAPVNRLSCCKAPVAPDRATSQARDAQHFDLIARMPVAAVTLAIFHPQNIVDVRGYSPPDRLASLALLCSRQI